MNLDAINSIQSLMSRIDQIQTRLDTSIKAPVSFDEILQQTLNNKMAALSQVPGMNFPPILGYNFPGMGQATWIADIARNNPTQIVNYNGREMQAQTADRFVRLEGMLAERFPGRQVIVTSTMDGKHSDPNHPAGKAVDFVIDGLTRDESVEVESICTQAGFKPYNEYINSSAYKTGDHMHIDLAE